MQQGSQVCKLFVIIDIPCCPSLQVVEALINISDMETLMPFCKKEGWGQVGLNDLSKCYRVRIPNLLFNQKEHLTHPKWHVLIVFLNAFWMPLAALLLTRDIYGMKLNLTVSSWMHLLASSWSEFSSLWSGLVLQRVGKACQILLDMTSVLTAWIVLRLISFLIMDCKSQKPICVHFTFQ